MLFSELVRSVRLRNDSGTIRPVVDHVNPFAGRRPQLRQNSLAHALTQYHDAIGMLEDNLVKLIENPSRKGIRPQSAKLYGDVRVNILNQKYDSHTAQA